MSSFNRDGGMALLLPLDPYLVYMRAAGDKLNMDI